MYLIGFGVKSKTAKGLLDKYFQGVETVDILDSIDKLGVVNASGNEYDRVIIYSKILDSLNDGDYYKVIQDLNLISYKNAIVVFYCTDKDIALALQDEILLYGNRMVVLYNGGNSKLTSRSLLQLVRDDINTLSKLYSLDGLDDSLDTGIETENIGINGSTSVLGVLEEVSDVEYDVGVVEDIVKEGTYDTDILATWDEGSYTFDDSNTNENTLDIEDVICEVDNAIVEETEVTEEINEDCKSEDYDITTTTLDVFNEFDAIDVTDIETDSNLGVEEELVGDWASALVTDDEVVEDIDETVWNTDVNVTEERDITDDWVDISVNESSLGIDLGSSMISTEPIASTTQTKKKGIFKSKSFTGTKRKVVHGSDINKLKVLLDSYGRKGCSIAFIGNNSGNTTVVDNIATITSSLGFSSLVVDLNILNRGLASITKDNYMAVHNTYTDSSSLREGLNSSLGSLSSIANVSKVDYHLLSSGLASQYIDHNNLVDNTKLNKFITASKGMYNFIIYDIPLEVVSVYAPVIYTSDIVVVTSRLSNKGLYDNLLRMCNIENDDVMDIIFTRGKILYTFDKNKDKLMGSRCNISNLGHIMDAHLKNLVGCELEYRFSNLDVVGSIAYSDIYDDLWGDKSIVNNREYMGEYLGLLENILT